MIPVDPHIRNRWAAAAAAALLGGGGAWKIVDFYADFRAHLAVDASQYLNHEHRLLSLETPGGRTVMATSTQQRFEALERRLERCERILEQPR